jgi:hypothetical protein
MKDEQTIVIGIPGKWKNREEIINAIAKDSGGYIFAGMMLMNSKSGESFGLEIYEHDPKLQEAFEYASMGKMTAEELQAIGEHTFTLYVIGTAGSIDFAQKMMKVTQALLKTGGIGVKVETTGKAFTREQWNAICGLADMGRYYDAFVTKLRMEDDIFYTCGMHNLGLKDTVVGAVDLDIASYTLDIFSIYQIMEQPDMKAGESFSASAESPEFRIFEEKDNRYPEDDAFYNKKGLWVLKPINDVTKE